MSSTSSFFFPDAPSPRDRVRDWSQDVADASDNVTEVEQRSSRNTARTENRIRGNKGVWQNGVCYSSVTFPEYDGPVSYSPTIVPCQQGSPACRSSTSSVHHAEQPSDTISRTYAEMRARPSTFHHQTGYCETIASSVAQTQRRPPPSLAPTRRTKQPVRTSGRCTGYPATKGVDDTHANQSQIRPSDSVSNTGRRTSFDSRTSSSRVSLTDTTVDRLAERLQRSASSRPVPVRARLPTTTARQATVNRVARGEDTSVEYVKLSRRTAMAAGLCAAFGPVPLVSAKVRYGNG